MLGRCWQLMVLKWAEAIRGLLSDSDLVCRAEGDALRDAFMRPGQQSEIGPST